MRGLANIVKKSQDIICEDWSTWLPIYYDFDTKTVSAKQTANNCYVTKLINPCTKEDVIEAIERWKRL